MTTPTSLPTMQETTYDVDGKKIFVAETGDGPPVVMLHGGGPGASGVSNYTRNIAELAERYRVIVPDMPGYGRSSKGVDSADPVGYLSRHIRGLLDELGLDKAHLVGNSYGGACALRLALDTPHRVDRMLLMGPAGVGTTRTVPTRGARSLLTYYTGEGPSRLKLETFIRNYLVFNAASVPDSAIEDRYQASIDPEVIASPPTKLPSGPGALRILWKSDFTRDPRLSRLSVPTLVLWGAEDKVNRPSGARMLADRMPNCDLYMVANTGHWVQFEQPDLFNRLCSDFLGGHR
ncbi:alpha/beta fold hydrolase [Streptomyces sp. NPDC092369]|uniref:alpha/beta fold hydrolase n=1 Tax=Streptomyces sp. NPDC092369 TaxID=3366015 RepID=UPI003808AA6A